MTRHTLGLFLALAGAAALPAAAPAQPSQLRVQLFAEAEREMAAAKERQADVLAPASYERAAEHYARADQNLTRGRSLEDIRSDLAEAARYFKQAADRTELARVSLSDPYEARQDALEAEAPNYAAAEWREAESAFDDAVRRLEAGNMNRARSAGEEAETRYRTAELTAIENNYLAGARRRIEEAERQRVDRYAPKTLERAKSLLAEAESRLRSDRYDTDFPRSLARQANYEAQHAMYLASRIRAIEDDRRFTNEDLLLEAEQAFVRIAGQLDIVAELDEGFGKPTGAVLDEIDALQRDRELLRQSDERVVFLQDELARLEARLGDESEQRKIQEQIQQRFAQLASVFARDEAVVLRRGDDVIVRLGLNFDSGSSVIKPEYFTLLRKIQTAVDVFPNSQVEVQGHTDAFGADEMNRALSERRAAAVQQYLLANMDDLGATVITAVGYGETIPLANNETAEGRARNRRIDLLIRPNLEMLAASLGN